MTTLGFVIKKKNVFDASLSRAEMQPKYVRLQGRELSLHNRTDPG